MDMIPPLPPPRPNEPDVADPEEWDFDIGHHAPTPNKLPGIPKEERDRLLDKLVATLTLEEIEEISARRQTSGGDPHLDAKIEIRETLRAHFYGARVYVGADLQVFYPGRKGFSPDILVVRGVEPRPRANWMVHKEGRGPDLIMEIHHAGERDQDFVRNVARYADLSIYEYFVYDITQRTISGFRLGEGGYHVIAPQGRRYHSDVLDLDLTLIHGRLRFVLLSDVLESPQERILTLSAELVEERARSARDLKRAEEAELALQKAERRLLRTRAQAVLLVLQLRGLDVLVEDREAIMNCSDLSTLDRWFVRSLDVASVADLFSGNG